MCGINGIVDFKDPIEADIVDKMNKVLHHRGPDGSGIFSSNNCVLGHTRLSIIDIEGSTQPLCNEDRKIWLTFNGEIYNYQDLRKLLLGKGHNFSTDGDSEVLVHLYEEYGYEMLKHLYGMFVFAIWDDRRKILFMARDRLGIKPIYFVEKDGGIVFSSEQKGLFKHPANKKNLNHEGIWNYLTFRSVPAPHTLYHGVHKLLPGHYLISSKNGVKITKYWDIYPDSNNLAKLSDDELISETESILRKSVKRRLTSDVPLGAFLSGGVDSSLIVALMSKITGTPVKTYTVGFENFSSSEAPYAKIVADLYNTDHHELIVQEDVYTNYLEKLTILRDAPLSEPADIPLYLLSKMANKEVKILLSGEGCDELFAGYPKYQFDYMHQYMKFLPSNFVNLIINNVPARFRKIELALKSLKEQHAATRWCQWFSPFNLEEKLQLFKGPTNGFINPIESYLSNYTDFKSSLSFFLVSDCKVWLPDNLLDRGDRMTMGASIEGRVPFLDHDLVELAFRMPDRVKVRGIHRKWIIKQIALKYLPAKIVNRPKSGFDVPLSQWFKGKMREYCYDQICSRNSLPEELISLEKTRTILDDHCTGRKDNYLQIWTLLGLALWYRSCLLTSEH